MNKKLGIFLALFFIMLAPAVFAAPADVINPVDRTSPDSANNLPFIVGVFCVSVFFLILGFMYREAHPILNFALIITAIFLLLLVPSELANQSDCEFVILNTTQLDHPPGPIAHTHVQYLHTRICTSIETNSRTSFFQVYNWFIRLFVAYLLLYLIWFVMMAFTEVGGTFRKTSIGKKLTKRGLI